MLGRLFRGGRKGAPAVQMPPPDPMSAPPARPPAPRVPAPDTQWRARLAADPDDAEALEKLAELLLRKGRLDEARTLLEPALVRLPAHPGLLFARGHLAQLSLEVPQAVTFFRQALAARSDDPLVQFHLATQLFQLGEMREGFELMQARHALPGHNTPPWARTIAPWRGEALKGKRLIVTHDWGGADDEIRFMRYLEWLAREYRPASLHVACSGECLRLVEAIPGVIKAFAEAGAVSADYQVGLMDLALVHGTGLDKLPAPRRYLAAPMGDVHYWQRKLAQADTRPALRVGLCWSASPWGGGDKSVPLALFAALGSLPGLRLVSLQKGAGRAEIAASDLAIEDHTAQLEDLADSAALIENLDIVVTVDTPLAHLAAALGKPVLLLLKRGGGTFWLLGRDYSPWYPTMKIFRQARDGEWGEVCARVMVALRHWPRD